MPVSFPTPVVSDMLAQDQRQVYFLLAEVSHPDHEPVRLVNNPAAIIHNGDEYFPFPFTVVEAAQDPEQTPRVRVSFKDPTGDILRRFRLVAGGPQRTSIRFTYISTADLDVVLLRSARYMISNATYTEDGVNIEANINAFLSVKFPKDSFNRTDFPGIAG